MEVVGRYALQKFAGRRAADSLNDRQRELARMSHAAYRDNDKANEMLKDTLYSVDPELSNENVKVFRRGRHAVVAYRGTRSNNVSDLAADVAVATGTHSLHPRFKEAVDVAKKAQAKYQYLELTGHSLGGSLAAHASKHTGVHATVYNPGTSPFFKEDKSRNVHVIRHRDDFISANGDQDVLSGAVGLATGAHSIQQFY